jgi:hypothetical protein
MPGKTFAPTTQSMLLSLDEMSHGLRRESHPKRVVFLCLEIIVLPQKKAAVNHSSAAFALK